MRALPLRFGVIHRGVGVAHQLVGRLLALLTVGDADAGRRVNRLAAELKRLAQRLDDALGDAHRVTRVLDMVDKNGELVAAKT